MKKKILFLFTLCFLLNIVLLPATSALANDNVEKEEVVYTYSDLDKTMCATGDVYIRTLPCKAGEKLGVLYKKNTIQVTGQCNETGWYRVKYKDNEAYISGKYLKDIEVKAPVENEEKVIYLTFDDGPSKHTARLLEVLDKYDVKATFFVVTYKSYNYMIKEIYDAGHAVGIHTASHNYKKIYKSEEAYYKDLYKAQDVIFEQTGIRPTIIRFPGGSSNTVSKKYCSGIMTTLSKSVIENGFQYFDWNVDSNDAGGAKTSEEVYNNVIKAVKKKKTSVVLQHDTQGFSVDAVEDIIVWALENGYTFKTLDMNSPTAHHRINN